MYCHMGGCPIGSPIHGKTFRSGSTEGDAPVHLPHRIGPWRPSARGARADATVKAEGARRTSFVGMRDVNRAVQPTKAFAFANRQPTGASCRATPVRPRDCERKAWNRPRSAGSTVNLLPDHFAQSAGSAGFLVGKYLGCFSEVPRFGKVTVSYHPHPPGRPTGERNAQAG